MHRYSRGRGGYARSVIHFLGHLLGTAVMFAAILLVAWGLAYMVHYLHASHPFPDSVYQTVIAIETWLVYIDVAVCAIVLAFGIRRFIKDIAENLS